MPVYYPLPRVERRHSVISRQLVILMPMHAVARELFLYWGAAGQNKIFKNSKLYYK